MKIYIETYKRANDAPIGSYLREQAIHRLRQSNKRKSVREVAKMLFLAYHQRPSDFDFGRLSEREILTAIEVRNIAYGNHDLEFQDLVDIRKYFRSPWKRFIARLALRFLSAEQLRLLAYHQRVTEDPQPTDRLK